MIPTHFLGRASALLGLFVLCQLLQADPIGDGDCLTCHKDPSLKQALTNGHTRSLFVDPRDWQADVHRAYDMSCVDCHVDATPFSHPVGGFHGKECDVCHAEECEEFERTVHATHAGTAAFPVCFDCHTKHSVRRKNDPEASIYRKKMVALCSPCHPAEAASKSLLNRLVFFRLSGHKKENMSGQYDVSRCIDCHFTDGAHGQPGALEERCATCHRRGAGNGLLFSPSVHAATFFGRHDPIVGLNVLYGIIFLGLVGVVILFIKRKTKGPGTGDAGS